MNTTHAQPIPDAGEARVFDVKRQLWRIPVGELFEDWQGKQRFEKVAEIINSRGEIRHVIQCLVSPFKEGERPGPFFTSIGTIHFREGSLKVLVRGERRKEKTMHKEAKTEPLNAVIKLGAFRFRCTNVIGAVAVNPVLPENFSSTANESRPDRHRVWWDVPYIEIYHDDHPQFIEHWKGNTRYDVRCLDGGAWDRPTCWGMFSTLEEALACAALGPVWLKGVA